MTTITINDNDLFEKIEEEYGLDLADQFSEVLSQSTEEDYVKDMNVFFEAAGIKMLAVGFSPVDPSSVEYPEEEFGKWVVDLL